MANGKPGAPKGHPKHGGRVAGTKNAATRVREQAIALALVAETLTPEQQAELTPLSVILRVMRARTAAGDDAGALIAAQAAAPYCHARLSSSDVRVTGSLSTQSDADVEAAIRELEQKLQAARIAERRAGLRLIEGEALPP